MTAEDVIREFTALSAIPRCSGNEKAAVDYVVSRAKAAGYSSKNDTAGNVSIHLPATAGLESAPVLVIQGHLDMVCVRDSSSSHDFSSDSIVPTQKGDFISAEGTTLGADNGIAVALALAIMEDRDLPHGPLELLFTVEEETGLIGATNLDNQMIRGAYLINLDSEEDYQIYIGCAGGVLITAEGTIPAEPFNREGLSGWKLTADGLKGGHSGADIDGSPENLFRRFASFLTELADLRPIYAGLEGKGKINAIPTNCEVFFLLPEDREQDLLNRFHPFEKVFIETYADPEAKLTISPARIDLSGDTALSPTGGAVLLDLIMKLPSGVLERNETLGGQVSTSANLGVISVDAVGRTHLEIGLRSDRSESLESGEKRINEALAQAGLAVTNIASFPPWPPAPDSPLVSFCQSCREGVFDEPAEIVTSHGGLECGVLSAKAGGMEAVSIGPNIFEVHTIRERIQVSSLEKFVRWLSVILARQGELG